MAEVKIIGIVPKDIIEVKTDLTPRLKANFDNFINTAINELKNMGVEVKAKPNQKSLEEIIKLYEDPKAERLKW